MQEAINARLEADYGIKYAFKAFSDNGKFKSREVALCYTAMQSGRMSLGRHLLYAGSPNPYPESTNVNNNVIESKVDVVAMDDVKVSADHMAVTHIKFLRNGLHNLIDKLIDIRMKPQAIQNPKHIFMSTQSLNDAISSFENAFNWLGAELGKMVETEEGRGKYPSFGEKEVQVPGPETPNENVAKTEELMDERAKSSTPAAQPEEDPNRPLTGKDFLPGGRAHKG